MFLTTIIAALCVALPILVVVSFVITGVSDAWPHLLDTLLGQYALNSLLLSMLVAVGVIMLGVPAAWIISFYRFRGEYIIGLVLIFILITIVLYNEKTTIRKFIKPEQWK